MTSKYIEKVQVCCDGASSGNPGPSGIGIVIYDDAGNELQRHSEHVGHRTNNEAEYLALIKGLKLAAGKCRKNVVCFSDSELVIKQVNREYRVKRPHLLELLNELLSQTQPFDRVDFFHAGSGQSTRMQLADKLAKRAARRPPLP